MLNQSKIKRAFACLYFFALVLSLFILQIAGQSSGGSFTLEKSVVAGGGRTSGGGTFTLTGTAGQTAAGAFSQMSLFNERSGFWTPDAQAPTAGESVISGRVADLRSGDGIDGVKIILTEISTGEIHETTTNEKGNYTFTGVDVGKFYIITAAHRTYSFIPPQLTLSLVGDSTDLDFFAVKNVN